MSEQSKFVVTTPAQVGVPVFPKGVFRVVDERDLATPGYELVAILPQAVEHVTFDDETGQYGSVITKKTTRLIPGHRFLVVLPEESALAQMQACVAGYTAIATESAEKLRLAVQVGENLKGELQRLERDLAGARDHASKLYARVQAEEDRRARGELTLAERTRHVRVLREALGSIQADKLIAKSDKAEQER